MKMCKLKKYVEIIVIVYKQQANPSRKSKQMNSKAFVTN